jgi:dihydroneopterin aldolase
MSTLYINNLRVHAHHGCLPEETIIGGEYRIDAEITADFTSACQSDSLSETVDYCDVRRIAEREMAVRSKLIEHVVERMGRSLLTELPQIISLKLKLTKLSPPMGGDVESVSFESQFRREAK